MPLYEYFCDLCQDLIERLGRFEDQPPVCGCGEPRRMIVSTFGIVNTGLLGGTKYNDSRLENYHQQGHWAMEKDPKTGKRNIPTFIETFQQQREYCKRNGLYNPGEVGQVEAGADGKSLTCRGLPGSW